nr:FAD-dependent monooxygenase [Erwinia oleae]
MRRYIIGADGGHSTVRHLLGLGFDGEKYPQNFLLGDVHVDWQWDHERFRIFMHGERIGLFLPLGGNGLSRVMTTDMNGGSDNDAEQLRLETLQQAFSEAAQVPVTLSNARWLSKFSTHHRIVDRYRSGHIFVAGDAAHIHSPAGGQGMNTGLQDAANLVWKIKNVLHHHAAAPLLDSYEYERLPVARETLAFTDKIFHLAAGQKGWRASFRDRIAPLLIGPASRLHSVQERAFRKFGQLDIRYAQGSYISDISESDSPAQPGDRAPDAQITRHQDLFDLLAGYRFTLMLLSRKPLEPQHAESYLKRLSSVRASLAQTLLLAPMTTGSHAAVISPTCNDVFTHYGLHDDSSQAVLLIRPDGFIAWRSNDDNLTAADAWLTRFFAAPV